MASVVFGILGAGIGALFGNPMMGFAIGNMAGGMLFPPRMGTQERGKMDDLRVSGSGAGAMIPICYGNARVGGNVLWMCSYDPVTLQPVPTGTPGAVQLLEHRSEQTHGGKGGPSQTVVTYTYTASCAVLICRGPICAVQKIYAEDVCIYDAAQDPPSKHTIRVYLGTESQAADSLYASVEGAVNAPAYRGSAYVVLENLDLTAWNGRLPNLNFEIEETRQSVRAILKDVAAQVGLDSSEIDFDCARARVDGYTIPRRMPAREAIAPLLRCHFTDLFEADGQVIALPRGEDIALTIDAGDLGARVLSGKEDGPISGLQTSRTQELELPQALELTYFCAERQYDQAVQRANRDDKALVQEAITVAYPGVLTDDAARRIAETLLYLLWLERDADAISLPIKYLRLVPCSPVHLPIAGENRRRRVMGMDFGLFGEIRLKLVPDEPDVLTQGVAGGALPAATMPFAGAVATTGRAWSGNALRDEDADGVGLYLMATGGAGWGGCAVYWSRDGEASYQHLETLTDSAVMGTAATGLGNWTGGTASWDTVNTVEVSVVRGALETTSDADVLSGANALLLGDEVIQFATATVVGTNRYQLARLLRGQRGTVISSHAAGEMATLLTRGTVKRTTLGSSLAGRTVKVKFVSPGEAIGAVTAADVAITGNELKPYAGVHLAGSRDGSGNLTITWKRRARRDYEMRDLSDIPLDTSSESYEVDIMNGATVVRTITGLTDETASYSAAQQVTDFGSAQSSVTARVYQIGSLGRGHKLEGTV